MNAVQNIYRDSQLFFTSLDQKTTCDTGFCDTAFSGISFICHSCSLDLFSLFHDSRFEKDAGNKENWLFFSNRNICKNVSIFWEGANQKLQKKWE